MMSSASGEPTVATAARVYDFMLGGTHNYAVDQAAGAQTLRVFPLAAVVARYNREFLGRAVRFLAGEGIRQFLDLGSGIPTVGNVHEIAQAEAPDSRVVYVDYEPEAVDLGRNILARNPYAAFLQADLRDPAKVLGSGEVRALLDFAEPVGLLMVSVLPFVPDFGEACDIVHRYRDRLAPGSYLVLSHLTPARGENTLARQQEVRKVYNRNVAEQVASRSAEEIAEFFTGMELVPPGLVQVPDWHPDEPGYLPDEEDEARKVGLGGVARKP